MNNHMNNLVNNLMNSKVLAGIKKQMVQILKIIISYSRSIQMLLQGGLEQIPVHNNIIPLIMTVLTIIGNGVIPRLMGKSIGKVSDERKIMANPSGFTFAIWSLIYIGLLYLSVSLYMGWSEWGDTSIILFSLSCILNCAWIILWISEFFTAAAITIFLMIVSLLGIWIINLPSNDVIGQNIVATYIGWLIGAFALNISASLKPYLKDSTLSLIDTIFVSLVQTTWQLIHANSKSRITQSLAVPLVGVWTSIGIASNGSGGFAYGFPFFIISSLMTVFAFIASFTDKNLLMQLYDIIYRFLRRR